MSSTMTEPTDEALKDGIYLADGTYVNAEAGLAPPDLWIWYNARKEPGDLTEAARLFDDPEKTQTIKCVYAGGRQEIIYEGYTHLVAILTDGGGRLSIRMREEEK